MYKALDPGSLGIQKGVQEHIRLAAAWGFHGVMLSPDDILAQGIGKVNDWMEEYGVVNAGFGIGSDYNKKGDEYGAGLLALSRRAKAARATGAVRSLTWIPPGSDELTYDQQYDDFASRLRPCAKILEEEGISLALEFIGTHAAYETKKYPFIHTMPEMLRLCNSIGTRGCGLLLDAHHMHTAGHAMDDALALRADQVAFVHINDAMPGYTPETLPDSPRVLPGESGVIDCTRLLNNLKRIGYEGPVVVEPFYAPFKSIQDADEIVRLTAESIARVWPKENR